MAKKRHGCLISLLIFIVILALVTLGVWKFGINRGPGKLATQIINGPVDKIASQSVKNSLGKAGILGTNVAVVPLPGTATNAAIISLDPAEGYSPPAGAEAKKKQALTAIKQIVESNKNSNLNIARAGVVYSENGVSAISLTVPMTAMTALTDGKISEAEFLAQTEIKVDINNLNAMNAFPDLNDLIGDYIFKGVFQ